MKVKELFEAKVKAQPHTGEQIEKALKMKGVKVYTPTLVPADSGDGKGTEEWNVRVTYKSNRGKPGYERIQVYKSTDGDWGFSSETENMERGTLEDLLSELRDYVAHSATFYAKPAAVKEEQLAEGYEGRILRLLDLAGIQGHFENGILYVQTKSDVMKAVKAMERDSGLNKFPTIDWVKGN